MRTIEGMVDEVPVLLLVPAESSRPLALWMSHLGGSASKELPMLEQLAADGYPAVSFDPPGHGRRSAGGDPWDFATEILGQFRRRMWPLLGVATLDAMRVLTWAQGELGCAGADVVAGGVSMGGDIAVALAGADARVRRVATVGSTPDWQRPDMRELTNADRVVEQGVAEPYGRWLRDRLDPMLHVDSFPPVPVSFDLGEDDRHVPAANAAAFRDALVARDNRFTSHVRVQVHPGLDHRGVTTSPTALAAARGRLADPPL